MKISAILFTGTLVVGFAAGPAAAALPGTDPAPAMQAPAASAMPAKMSFGTGAPTADAGESFKVAGKRGRQFGGRKSGGSFMRGRWRQVTPGATVNRSRSTTGPHQDGLRRPKAVAAGTAVAAPRDAASGLPTGKRFNRGDAIELGLGGNEQIPKRLGGQEQLPNVRGGSFAPGRVNGYMKYDAIDGE